MKRYLYFLLIFLTGITGGMAKEKFHTQASLLSENQVIVPGQSFDVGVLLKMDKGWHTYWKDAGDSGMPTSIKWKLPKDFTAGPIQWPKPEVVSAFGMTSYGYENEVLLIVPIQTPKTGVNLNEKIDLEAKVDWLECEKTCVPGNGTVRMELKWGKTAQASANQALFEKYRKLIPPADYHPKNEKAQPPTSNQPVKPSAISSVPFSFSKALFFAFIGGMILNLMPCVLPVLAIKILGFVKQGHDDPREARQLGMLFGLGVLVSFWILAAIIIGFRSAGTHVGWGFQFQDARFVVIMAWIVTVISLNFFGVFEIEFSPTSLQEAGNFASKHGKFGAFLNGVLATALATPCTAPFLAPALGFAFSQPAFITFSILTAVGVGLALPYVILSWKPEWLKWLPKPGMWMIRFKQIMGFPMLATALWLVWIVGSSYGNNAAFAVTGWLLLTAFLVFLASAISPTKRGVLIVSLIFTLAIGHWKVSPLLTATASESKGHVSHVGIDWKPYSKKGLEDVLKNSSGPVFVDFTADWCLTCQANKKTAIEVESVAQKMKELKATALLADWTRKNDEITQALESFGRSGVPLYVVYPSDRSKPPIVLPEVFPLTPQMVLDAFEQATN